jgi:hypothetical protein
MKRREFITLLAGSAALWPRVTYAQPAKLIGVLGVSTQANWSRWTTAFVQRLRELGWTEGRNVAIEYRWADGRGERFAEYRGRARPAQGGCHRVGGQCHPCRQAGNLDDPDRVRDCGRSGRERHGHLAGATGW